MTYDASPTVSTFLLSLPISSHTHPCSGGALHHSVALGLCKSQSCVRAVLKVLLTAMLVGMSAARAPTEHGVVIPTVHSNLNSQRI